MEKKINIKPKEIQETKGNEELTGKKTSKRLKDEG